MGILLASLTPELGRSPGEGKGYPLQHSCQENSMNRIVHGVAKSRIQLSFTFTFNLSFTGKKWQPQPNQSHFMAEYLAFIHANVFCIILARDEMFWCPRQGTTLLVIPCASSTEHLSQNLRYILEKGNSNC